MYVEEGDALADGVRFPPLGSSVCVALSVQDVSEESFHQDTMRCRPNGGYFIITLHSASPPPPPLMFPPGLQCTQSIHFYPTRALRLGCMALIDSWLSSVPLYLFQSRPFTFTGLLIIYLDILLVKSAVLGSWQAGEWHPNSKHEGSSDGQKPPDQTTLQRSSWVCRALLTDG